MGNEREQDVSRLVAMRAAEALVASKGQGLVLAAQLGLVSDGLSVRDLTGSADGPPERIGIWDPVEEDGKRAYRRPASASSAQTRWADVERIPPKSAKKRFVLIGESVARGFFFDPYFTPAQVLESMLGRALPGGAEVVDLAANDLSAAELTTLLSRVRPLQPDGIVIFAGNNWGAGALLMTAGQPQRRQIAAAVLRKSGVPGLKAFLEREFVSLVTSNLQLLPQLAAATGLPIVVLVPEFNLMDWRTDPTCAPPWLSGDHNRSWWIHHDEAIAAIKAEDWDAVAVASRKLLELDGGTTPFGSYFMARSMRARGEEEGAARHLEAARDCRIWDVNPLSPRCYAAIQAGLKRLNTDLVRVVDLPSVLRKWGGAIPDRRMFMDYCHLSVDGIRVAMASAAEALLAGKSDVKAEQLLKQDDLRPDATVEGMAHLLAAVHNAHWGQDAETVRYHVDKAISISPAVAGMARHLLEMQGRIVPAPFTAVASSLTDGAPGASALLQFMLRYNRRLLFDRVLVDSLAQCLSSSVPDSIDRVAAIRAAEWSCQDDQPVDLLRPQYRDSYAERSWPRESRAFYRAYASTSVFPLVLANAHATSVGITCRRAPFFTPEGRARVWVNGSDLGELELAPRWTTTKLRIPEQAVAAGVNELRIEWPRGAWDSDAALERAADELEFGRMDELLASYADISSLQHYASDKT